MALFTWKQNACQPKNLVATEFAKLRLAEDTVEDSTGSSRATDTRIGYRGGINRENSLTPTVNQRAKRKWKGLELTRGSSDVLRHRRALLRHVCDTTLIVDTVRTILGWTDTNLNGILSKGGWIVHCWTGTRWYWAIGILFIAPLYFFLAVGGGHFSLPPSVCPSLFRLASTRVHRSRVQYASRSINASTSSLFLRCFHLPAKRASTIRPTLPPELSDDQQQPPSPRWKCNNRVTSYNRESSTLRPAATDRVKVAWSPIDPADATRRGWSADRFTFGRRSDTRAVIKRVLQAYRLRRLPCDYEYRCFACLLLISQAYSQLSLGVDLDSLDLQSRYLFRVNVLTIFNPDFDPWNFKNIRIFLFHTNIYVFLYHRSKVLKEILDLILYEKVCVKNSLLTIVCCVCISYISEFPELEDNDTNNDNDKPRSPRLMDR